MTKHNESIINFCTHVSFCLNYEQDVFILSWLQNYQWYIIKNLQQGTEFFHSEAPEEFEFSMLQGKRDVGKNYLRSWCINSKLKTCATTGFAISCYRERYHVFVILEYCKFNKFLGPRPKHNEHLTSFQITVKLQTPNRNISWSINLGPTDSVAKQGKIPPLVELS